MLKKGDIVLCDTCDTPVFKLTRDVEVGESVDETLLRALLPQPKAIDGEISYCKHCGGGIEFNKFRTKKGKTVDLSDESYL